MNTQAIAIKSTQAVSTLEDLTNLGQIFVKSGFFTDTRDAAQAIVKVMAGGELGFSPIASMTGVYIVKGKVSLSANLMAAAIKRSGKYNFRVRKLDARECEIEFFEKGESIGVSSFTMAEAQQAGLTNNATWKNFPRNMLYARAMSNGSKWYCPDVFGGPIYTPDELGAVVDGETGEVIDLEPEPPAKPQPQPAKVVSMTAAAEQGSEPQTIDAEPVDIDDEAAAPALDAQVHAIVNLVTAFRDKGVADDKIKERLSDYADVELDTLDPDEIAAAFSVRTAAAAIEKMQSAMKARK